MSGYQFNFPPIYGALSLSEQLQKVSEEAREARAAYFDQEGAERIAEEVLDTIHACETALVRLVVSRLLNYEDIGRIADEVIKKNDERGYYG